MEPPEISPLSQVEIPLIEEQEEEKDETLVLLDESIHKLYNFFKILGFNQTSLFNTSLSCLSLFTLSIILPLLIIFYADCSDCDKFQIRFFEIEILVFQAMAAAVSLFCISHNLRKYGLKILLFVKLHYHQHLILDYVHKIHVFYRTLAMWMVVCFLLKTAREVTRIVYLHDEPWWQSVVYLIATLLCWAYSTVLFLSGTGLFCLVGNLQVLHFENYGKLFDKDLDVSVYIEEHMHLTYYLSKISHRFRIFILLEFLVVTASQFMALLHTTGNKGVLNFINAGDFAVLSIVQLVGITLCLNAAAKISHRAQSLGSITSRWHALATCNSNNAQSGVTTNGVLANPVGNISRNQSESDIDPTDYVPLPTNLQVTSHMSSYQRRQSFVTYMQANTGGFTMFGWIVDRHFIDTIFFIEMSLVFFVLGKTINITLR